MTTFPRISFMGANHAAQSRLRNAFAQLDKANQRASTGKAYTRPSENASAAARAAVLQDNLDQLTTFGRAIDDARSRLSIADTKLQETADLYHHLTELSTQAASSTSSPAARRAIAVEVTQVRDEIVAIANTRHLGAPLFAGLQPGDAVAYDVPTSSWVFTGAATERMPRRVAAGEVVDANITAKELFSTATDDIFTVLDDLTTALNADSTSGIQATMSKVQSLQSMLASGQSQIGAALNRVDLAADRNSAIHIVTTAELSSLRDVDMADAITDQSRLSMVYQSALGVTAKANEQTLLDWWR
jgi:flagellar hook-associated protein 3 FlgL